MKEEKYNGWTNWDTWNLNLWLTNDEKIYNGVIWILKNPFTKDELKNYVNTLIDTEYIKDDINLDLVNWQEIIDGFREDLE